MESIYKDLFLNLLAEGIGIVVTVFVVDRMAKSREERKWLPAKKYAHAHLMKELDKFLTHILGSSFENERKGSSVFYEFGDIPVLGEASYKNYDPINVAAALNSHQNLYEVLQKKFDFAPMRNLSNSLKNSLITSAHLFSPELRNTLIGLDNHIYEYIQNLDGKDLDMDGFMKNFPLGTYKIVTMTIDARIYVEKEADKVISMAEGIAEASQKIDKASKYIKERFPPK